ncbi:sulfite exporter TauE/SafE family protein [Herbaspirillum autotrophicum]|uniref:sulfite exporter TauE/SafE family protein n=1 Tax=Herbaspirillum autotrophicum TaxID=180195 RepID=UPI00067DA5AD|nr:sulfite exporter TauE/SafE family protein [Herbaspirillum autotrophicum]
MLYLILAACGAASGLTTVLFGFGGGFVVVPLLYHMLKTTYGESHIIGQSAMHIAVATSTCVMIVNAVIASRRHARAGNLDTSYLWPLAGYISIGAVLGAGAAVLASGTVVRIAFIAYLALTIMDCALRRGFLQQPAQARPQALGMLKTTGGGVVIGLIATFLGVGGSVMTVPLLRRCGLSMTQASAMANPLSLPVAIAGTLTYMVLAWYQPVGLRAGYIGYIDLMAFTVLTLGALVGMRCAGPLIGRMPDRMHARIYLGLLLMVLVSMLAG